MEIKIVNKSNNILPQYETEHAAGMDLRANIDEEVVIKPLERKIIPTGIFIGIPIGYEVQIRPRSGLAAKYGVTVLNTPGTIDSDYRGEIKIILINLGNEDFKVSNNERIAQMIISRHEKVEWNLIENFDTTTQRGEGGFGHTGNK